MKSAMMTPDLLPGVELAMVFAERKCPELKGIKHAWCDECDAAHDQEPRQLSHTYHRPKTICWARAITDQAVEHQIGICLHEYGHLLAGDCGSVVDDEAGADLAVLDRMGVEIRYVGPHELQTVELGDLS